MTRRQFRVLYREFLFRMVDLEVLSARGDMSKLLGQFVALLAAVSLMLAGGALRYFYNPAPREALLAGAWTDEQFLISITMMVVGLFTVLCWDSTFPNRRDVLVLSPLPVRARTLFLAKVAALGAALGLTVAATNVFSGLTYPLALGSVNGGFIGMIRAFAAYWITMLAAGAFVICSVLFVQGVAAQLLPRRLFLRVSAFLQLAAFCLFLSVFFLEPHLATPEALTAPENQTALTWLPSYWFLGLFQLLNGSMHPAFDPLLQRALFGLAVVGLGALAAFLLSYLRTIRRIVEEPDISPGTRAATWSPALGNSLQTAVVSFSARTLFRSRQHRVILAMYLGIGFAIALAYGQSRFAGEDPLVIASVVMMSFAVVGVRVVFSLPLALAANWIFRITAVRNAPEYLTAIRRALFTLAVAPVLFVSAVLFFWTWPLLMAAGHLVVLALLGSILALLSLRKFRKIPFTCSYLPGRANVHVTSGAYTLVLLALAELGVDLEMRALDDLNAYIKMIAVLVVAAFLAYRRSTTGTVLQFEEAPPEEISAIQLRRDGALLLDR